MKSSYPLYTERRQRCQWLRPEEFKPRWGNARRKAAKRERNGE